MERRRSVLVVSAIPPVGVRISEQLPEGLFQQVRFAESAEQAEELLEARMADFVIFFSPDPVMKQLSFRLAAETGACILWMVGDAAYPSLCEDAAQRGVCVITVSVGETAVTQTIVNLTTMSERLQRAGRESAMLRGKLDDVKLLQRAKLLLIQRLGMSEDAAHRYLEKTAMDSGKKLRDVAQSIIKTYEY